METANKRKRIEYLDTAKGIGIIMVVWAHANGPFRNYMYQMHMPFFFLLSGLLYNSGTGLKDFFLKRLKALYIPFVFWNSLSFCLKSFLHGILARSIAEHVIKIFLMIEKDGQFFGATWFLPALFMVEVAYKMLDICLGNMKNKELIFLILFSSAACFGFIYTLEYMFSRTLILSMFYVAGVVLQKHRQFVRKYISIWSALPAAILFILIAGKNSANMGANKYTSPVLFVVGSFAASYALLYFCRSADRHHTLAVKRSLSLLKYFGTRSKDIVIWQFAVFRIIIIIQMLLNHESISAHNILSYYPVYSADGMWWIAYTVTGLFASLLVCDILRKGITGRIVTRFHLL